MSKKKVFIGVGHGGADPGATSGGFKEADMNLVMATECQDVLVDHDIEVRMSRYKNEDDALAEEIKECNAFKPDLAVDCHNNAGGGDGFEVIHYSKGGTSKVLAANIEGEVVKIGQNSRGLKTRLNSSGKDYFGFIRETSCPAVICEGVFIDNPKDMEIADTIEEQKAFGRAYAKGILKTLDIPYKGDKPNTKPPAGDSKPRYIVATGAYANIENARAEVNKLKSEGISAAYIHDCEQLHK